MGKKQLIFLTVIGLLFLVSMNTLADTITLEKKVEEEIQFSKILTDLNANDHSLSSGEALQNSEYDQFNHSPRSRRRPHPNRGPGPGPDGAFLMLTMSLFFIAIILSNP